jgi:prophage regulatory protein
MTNNTAKPLEQERMPLILRRKQVLTLLSISASTLYLQQKSGRFPLPVKLSDRATGWLTSDIQSWLKKRADERAA